MPPTILSVKYTVLFAMVKKTETGSVQAVFIYIQALKFKQNCAEKHFWTALTKEKVWSDQFVDMKIFLPYFKENNFNVHINNNSFHLTSHQLSHTCPSTNGPLNLYIFSF